MLTLSYGYKKPQSGDPGSVWFPAMEDNMQRLNDHKHDGTDSTKLTTAAITPTSDTISHLNWLATAGGTYRQVVTTPASITTDAHGMQFIIANGPNIGQRVYPSVEKITATTYYVYTNDNTLDYTVLYLA